MLRYNIYAGLGGGFGGPQYMGTGEFESEDEALEVAYALAREEYESYEGYHGILDWYDVAKENDLDPDSEEDYYLINEYYDEEIENWIEYYVILTEEDKETPKEELYEL